MSHILHFVQAEHRPPLFQTPFAEMFAQLIGLGDRNNALCHPPGKERGTTAVHGSSVDSLTSDFCPITRPTAYSSSQGIVYIA